MSPRRSLSTGARALLLSACASCSLVDLSSRIDQASCKYDAECEILNTTENPDFKLCEPFYCSVRQLCEPARRDSDHDGFSTKECKAELEETDCPGDDNPELHPGALELCDELDNDCDSRIDEGVLAIDRSVALDFADAKPASDIVYAHDAARRKLTLSYALEASPPVVAANSLDDESDASQTSRPIMFAAPLSGPLRAEAASVGSLSSRAMAIAAYTSDTPRRIIVGSLDSAASTVSYAARGMQGLACAADEMCGNDSGSPMQPSDAPFSDAPALAASADGTLVAYTRNPDRSPGLCQAEMRPLAKRVLGNVVASAGIGGGVAERTRAPMQLGLSGDSHAPAVLGIPAQTTNGQAYGWLVAYSNVQGQLQIAQVTLVQNALEVFELSKLGSDAGPLRAPRLALGRAGDGHVALGLVAERGCADASRIVFGRFDAQLEDDARITLRNVTRLTELDDTDSAQNQRAPSLTHSATRASWAVAYRDASGLRARLLSDDGIPTGDTPYLLASELAGSERDGSTAIIPLGGERAWFAVFAYMAGSNGTPARVWRSTLSSCATLKPDQRITVDTQ